MTIFIACQKNHLNEEICDCANSPTIQYIDSNKIIIPNIFTPNGDGYNDGWIIPGITSYPDFDVKVMNTGIFPYTVFHSKNFYGAWFGKDNGVIKGGKYRYVITIGSHVFKGYVCVFAGKKYEKYNASDFDCIHDCVALDPGDPLLY